MFTAVLLAVGLALIVRAGPVMPWPLDADTSAVIGWIFFGDAWYFLFALVRPDWTVARMQLWSFLAYDLVLIVPLINHLAAVPPELRANLLVYIAVLVYSGGLAAYYLLLNPRTRRIDRRRESGVSPVSRAK